MTIARCLPIAALLFLTTPANAADPAVTRSTLRALGATDPEGVKHALTTLGERNDTAALPALEAFYDDRLKIAADGAVFIAEPRTGRLLDPLTAAPVTPAPAGPLRTAEMDNELRRVALPVMARLRLSAASPAVRLAAAEELAQGAPDDVIALMRAAAGHETDRKVKDALSFALARHDLQSASTARQVAALRVLEDLGKPAARADIEPLARKTDADPAVREAAGRALSAIQRRERLVAGVGNVLYGFSLASVFLFAALGLAITFGVMGVINMAHGEMLTIGAYTTYAVQVLFQRHLPGLLPYYLLAAIPLAFVVATATGVLLERGVIRHLYGRPLETLLATWGISLALIQTIRLVFGAANVAVANPPWLAGGSEVLSGLVLPWNRIGVIVFVIAAAAFVYLLLQRTSLGLQVRAVTQNRSMASCMGISTARIDMWTFGLGSGIAGLGGVALSQIGNVGPELGQAYIIDSFMVVVLGGVGRIAGTVGAALGLGLVQKLLEPISGAVLGKIAVLVVIILFIQRRPQGMFPVKGRVEA
jgi:urea transport system permease protein